MAVQNDSVALGYQACDGAAEGAGKGWDVQLLWVARQLNSSWKNCNGGLCVFGVL